jgi:putative toxin-antitoxin system antitoxin component (TIGR02293 family)
METLEDRTLQVKLRAIDVFGNEAKALRWLNAPRPQFNDRSPLSIIDTDEGYEEVMCMLLRIAHGVYS